MKYPQWYKNILLTWKPKSGKSTMLDSLLASVKEKTWIITKQVLDEGGTRMWFNIVDNKWKKFLLSSTTIRSDKKFADKYWIHSVGIKEIMNNFAYEKWDLIYLDEVAPMQIAADWFKEFATSLLDSKNPLLWTIKLDDNKYEFIQQVKTRKDTLVLDILGQEFNEIFLANLVKKIEKSQKYLTEKERFQKLSENERKMDSQSSIRTLHTGEIINCDCDFYENYGICSHSISLRQII